MLACTLNRSIAGRWGDLAVLPRGCPRSSAGTRRRPRSMSALRSRQPRRRATRSRRNKAAKPRRHGGSRNLCRNNRSLGIACAENTGARGRSFPRSAPSRRVCARPCPALCHRASNRGNKGRSRRSQWRDRCRSMQAISAGSDPSRTSMASIAGSAPQGTAP